MATQSLLHSLFRYKASVDDELIHALGHLADGTPGEIIDSALRVLNHMHRVDKIFAAHLSRTTHSYNSSWGNDVPALSDLGSAIRETDNWYLDYISEITANELEDVIDFMFTDGQNGRMSREEMLAHVMCHGGYHRGEVGRLLPRIEATSVRDVFAGYLHRAEPQRRN